jgi:hypothetical protein
LPKKNEIVQIYHKHFGSKLKNKTLVTTLIGLILYRLSIDYSYTNIISILFDYQGYRVETSIYSILISWIFLITLTPFIIKIFFKPNLSSNILSVLILISLIPTTTMIAFNSYYQNSYIFLIYIYWFTLLYMNIKVGPIIISKNRFEFPSFYKYLAILLSVIVVYLSWKFTGLRFHFGLLDVYDLRLDARDYNISSLGIGYLSTMADNLLPSLLVLFIYKKRWLFSLLLSLVILLNFGITATKQILFLLVLAVASFSFIKNFKFSRYYLWFFLFLVDASIVEFKFFNSWAISLFSTYRIMIIPAKLHYSYFSFFSNGNFDYFRQSFFKWFWPSTYKENIGFLLGEFDTGDIGGRANNGLFSDAYMNIGAIGSLVFPLILIFINKVLEGATLGLNERILSILVISISFVLLGLPFSTALISAGILLLIFFYSTLPRRIFK